MRRKLLILALITLDLVVLALLSFKFFPKHSPQLLGVSDPPSYSQSSYYSQSNYYSQSSYYSQGNYYSQSSYVSKPEYSQSSYATEVEIETVSDPDTPVSNQGVPSATGAASPSQNSFSGAQETDKEQNNPWFWLIGLILLITLLIIAFLIWKRRKTK